MMAAYITGCAAPYPPFANATPAQRASGQYTIDEAWSTNIDQAQLNINIANKNLEIFTNQNQ
jgi:hypothetical protein